MNNIQLIDLASRAFVLGLEEGHQPPEYVEDAKIRTGRSLMKLLLPTSADLLSNEYRMQMRLVYGAGFHLGQWRRHGLERDGERGDQ
jgi:hypothetical protein